jgi:HlyD family secretion protein
MPEIAGPTGAVDNEVENSQRETYYAAFVQAEAALRQAEQSVQQAQVDFDTARQSEITGIASAEQQVVQAQAGLDQVRVPEGESQVALAQASLELAQAQLAQLNPAPTKSQQEQVAAAIAQAEAALTQAQLNREYGELRAPFDGLVTTMAIETGEVVAPGTPVIDMFDTSAFRFEAPIADFDIARVQQGQQVRIRLDALPEDVFTGTVSYISPSSTMQGNVRTYVVRVDLEAAEGVRVGMSGQMSLETR